MVKNAVWQRRSSAPQVFQTFACDHYAEIDEHHLRADGRIDCDTAKHTGYKVYAGFMIALCEFFFFATSSKLLKGRQPCTPSSLIIVSHYVLLIHTCL